MKLKQQAMQKRHIMLYCGLTRSILKKSSIMQTENASGGKGEVLFNTFNYSTILWMKPFFPTSLLHPLKKFI